jgi:ssRNA-specific RNase YbeY (16S rRNA maturation enzyme)
MAQVALSIACQAWTAALPDAPALVEETVAAALTGAPVGHEVEVSVLLTDDAAQRELNRACRFPPLRGSRSRGAPGWRRRRPPCSGT